MPEEAVSRRETAPVTLLIVDDEQSTRDLCSAVAVQSGIRPITAVSAEEALEVLEQSPVDIVLTDLKLPETNGLELLQRIHDLHPHIAVMMLTQYGTIDSAVEATRKGALDYVTKPFRLEELRTRLERAVQAVELQQENRLLREQLRTRPGFGSLIGMSVKMERVYKLIEKVSQHEYPVLILGESGTGKELVAARGIHFWGARKDRPFVPVDCSALVSTLIESELFGYVKGAFTGAMQAKQGLLEAAHGGTLFLDEIGDMPVDLQAKLLRALQEREVKPVGSTERRQIDVRIIAATNRDLETAIRSGSFRQDLYFRLNVVQIKLPALRDRKGDIPLLVTSFLEKFSGSGPVRTISDDAMRRLVAYDWPGNVRELENAIERAVALSSGPLLTIADLPSNLQYPSSDRAPQKDELLPLEELERRAILRTLRETSGDKLAAARMLGIGKTTLYRKLKQYRMEPSED